MNPVMNKARVAASNKWFVLMLVACLTNGLGAFGMKVLTERNLSGAYEFQYLVIWYLGWFLSSILIFLRQPFRVQPRELLVSASMGFCSVAGQFTTGLALGHKIAGHVVFSISTGGTLFVVALAGIFLFKERVGKYGMAGLILGIASIVLLSIS
jgi:drug/metabolite transporter (DMT)-like permease